MKKKLFIAALAMVGGCDHHFGIGALEPDAGVAMSGRQGANDGGVGYQGPTTWTGYVEGYQFPSGSNAIRLAFAASLQPHGTTFFAGAWDQGGEAKRPVDKMPFSGRAV